MSEEIDTLEERLERLEPLEQEALAAKILENWQTLKGEKTSATRVAVSPIFGDAGAVTPRSCWFASLSLCSAFAGAIIGAAATFLGMAFFSPPKVEIREIVREVRVEAVPASDVKAMQETEPAADLRSSPAESTSENPSSEQPKTKKKLEERLALSTAPFGDLDSLLAARSALARQMARYESNVGSASSGFVRPRISPEEYRELLRELKL